MRQQRLVIDGADHLEGRGLLALSALRFAAAELAQWQVQIVNADEPVMHAAAESMAWDTGLHLSVVPADVPLPDVLAGAAFYVAVASRSTAHLPLAEVAGAGIPSLVAIQFPAPEADARTLTLARAAHDPKVLARRIVSELQPA